MEAAIGAVGPPLAADSVAASVLHSGGCHCGAVQFEVRAPAVLTVWVCNCSICAMRRNDHFIVPARDFALLSGGGGGAAGALAGGVLRSYRFGTRGAPRTPGWPDLVSS